MSVRIDRWPTLPEVGLLVILSLLVAVAVVILSLIAYALALKIPGVSTIVRTLLTAMLAPLALWVRDQVHQATEDIRQQVYPNGGDSITDRLDDLTDHVRSRFEDIEEDISHANHSIAHVANDVAAAESRSILANDRVNIIETAIFKPQEEDHAEEDRDRRTS